MIKINKTKTQHNICVGHQLSYCFLRTSASAKKICS